MNVEETVERLPPVSTAVLTGVAVSVGFLLYFYPSAFWLGFLPLVFGLAVLRWKPIIFAVVFLLPFNPFVQFGLPVHDIASSVRIVMFAGIALNRILTGKMEWRIRGKLTKALLLYFLIAVLSVTVFNPIRGPLAAASLFRLISYLCFYFSVLWFLDDEQDVHTILKLLFISTICVDLFGFYQLAIQDYSPIYRFLYPPTDAEHTIEPWVNRIPSVLGHFNIAAGYLNLIEPFALAVWLFERKWLAMVCSVLTGVAILCTQSRGGIFALAITLLLMLRLKSKTRWKFSKRLVGLAALGIPLMLAIGALFPRVTNTEAPEPRPLIWAAAVEVFRSHPILGVGWGNYRYLYGALLPFAAPNIMDAHNVYLQVLVETGIVGAIAFFILIRRSFKMTWSRAKAHDVIAIGCFGAVLSLLTHGFVDVLFHVGPQFMALLFLVFAMIALTGEQQNNRYSYTVPPPPSPLRSET